MKEREKERKAPSDTKTSVLSKPSKLKKPRAPSDTSDRGSEPDFEPTEEPPLPRPPPIKTKTSFRLELRGTVPPDESDYSCSR